jgi:hypothetical protein
MIAGKKGTKDKNKGVWLRIESEEGIKRILHTLIRYKKDNEKRKA